MNEDKLKINEDTIEKLEVWHDEDRKLIGVQITLENEYIWFEIDITMIEQWQSQSISYDGEMR